MSRRKPRHAWVSTATGSCYLGFAVVLLGGAASACGLDSSRGDPDAVLTVIPSAMRIATGTGLRAHVFTRVRGRSRDVTAQVRWSVRDTAVVTLVGSLVMGRAAGSTAIKIEFGAISDSVRVTVTSAMLTALTVEPPARRVRVGAEATFTAVGHFSDGSVQDLSDVVKWSSAGPGFAPVGPGRVRARAPGRARITAQWAQDASDAHIAAEARPAARGPLRAGKANPLYFALPDDTPVLLTGAHYWKNRQDNGVSNPPSPFDYVHYLDTLQFYDHNFFRLWVEEQARWTPETSVSSWIAPTIYLRTGPGQALDGQPKFDLTRLNPAFFERLRARVAQAAERGFYVSVMLFNGWSVETKRGSAFGDPWRGHPFNQANNVNGIDGDLDGDGHGRETHTLADSQITALQEAYVRRVVDAVNDLDNVLYEISNESDTVSKEWQYHMIEYLRGVEARKSRQHPIGMTAMWPDGHNDQLFASDADWISPNGDLNDPPIADGRKVVIQDTDHLCGICGDPGWVWRSVTRGTNPILMDGYDGSPGLSDAKYDATDPVWERIRLSLGQARRIVESIGLRNARPRGDLASTGFCLADPGTAFLVFDPGGAALNVNLTSAPVELSVEWISPLTGRTLPSPPVVGGAIHRFAPPFDGDAVLFIRRHDTVFPH